MLKDPGWSYVVLNRRTEAPFYPPNMSSHLPTFIRTGYFGRYLCSHINISVALRNPNITSFHLQVSVGVCPLCAIMARYSRALFRWLGGYAQGQCLICESHVRVSLSPKCLVRAPAQYLSKDTGGMLIKNLLESGEGWRAMGPSGSLCSRQLCLAHRRQAKIYVGE